MSELVRDDPAQNPNALHDFHVAKRGPKNVPKVVMANMNGPSSPKDPGHPYAQTKHISFNFYDQKTSNAPFGYEHFVSLPPAYEVDTSRHWPLILFLHGAGESQRGRNESYASIRHGIPKVVLCCEKLMSDSTNEQPSIDIPLAPRLRQSRQTKHGDKAVESVDSHVCRLLAENFITVTPSLDMEHGYGWNAPILSALLDEVIERYRVDVDRIHVSGFSMGGYGTWDLALQTPDRFASLMPICGGGDALRASLIKDVPHWVHHGDKDDIIPVRASINMVNALKKAGAQDIQFTRYPDLMHDSWTQAYGNLEVYKWMLDHKRSAHSYEKHVPDQNKITLTDQPDEP